ncbi:hydrogenase expression protein HypE [Aliidongia dinghuensis]|uniref:Hydrogenase expression protein HypE n=1 Tax=Aliidongia dinghuensis TaxID=1867774 RepID=A0A8J3E6K7_9PROT|nr:NADH-quinone oxidoreductase subunit C [Aliidongia dinghuensis]GGF41938.1 hydrogenase expression protein HypE [Aliidongia dinghuensis]
MPLTHLIADQYPVTTAPWPRFRVDRESWSRAAQTLASGEVSLVSLWAEPGQVHLALLDEAASPAEIAILSLACPEGHFPSVGAHHAPAIRLERTIRDLFGLEPAGAPDIRPWLDHGQGASYRFLGAEGPGLHQVPVGPVHAGIIEPGHFRFTVHGETVVRLEERLGYVHRGLEGLLAGAPLDRAIRLAGRASGDSTVAYALAFARAAEAALGIEAPARAASIRAVMAELERLANHLGDIGAIANDAAFALMLAHCGILRERVLRTADEVFGHRLMMDRIAIGGVATDLTGAGLRHIRALTTYVRRYFPGLVQLYDRTASLQDRTVGTGIAKPDLVRRFAAGGFIGRASCRAFDVRRALPYPPYDRLAFEMPVRGEGDVNARVWIRILEVEQSLALIDRILERLPDGPVATSLPAIDGTGREGVALVEGFRGDIFAWLSLDGEGRVARCHLRDPSWFQWPLLEAAIEGNILADFPLCNKSFNCSYAGHDL